MMAVVFFFLDILLVGIVVGFFKESLDGRDTYPLFLTIVLVEIDVLMVVISFLILQLEIVVLIVLIVFLFPQDTQWKLF